MSRLLRLLEDRVRLSNEEGDLYPLRSREGNAGRPAVRVLDRIRVAGEDVRELCEVSPRQHGTQGAAHPPTLV